MRIYIKKLLLVVFSLTTALSLLASGKRSPEQAAIMDVIGGLKIYEGINEGRLATNWLQVSEVLNLGRINETLKRNGYEPLDQNYVFVRQKIPIPRYQCGDVVLIRIAPIRVAFDNKVENGRFAISRYDGDSSGPCSPKTDQLFLDSRILCLIFCDG